MTVDHAITQAATAATRLMQVLSGPGMASGGSLTVVGTGIRAVGQLTLESLAVMATAESLLHVIGEPIQERAILAINPAARTLTGHYADGLVRAATYEAMVQEVLASVVAGRRTVAAFYGHPGVFTYPSHESVRRARAAGYPARMLPAVSAEDCLFADLGVDPGDGAQSYEATDFLFGGHLVDPAAHLFLWQVGTIGNWTYESTGYDLSALPALTELLLRSYPPRHVVTLYEASFEPRGYARVTRVPLARLAGALVTPATTLHVPPRPAWPSTPRVGRSTAGVPVVA